MKKTYPIQYGEDRVGIIKKGGPKSQNLLILYVNSQQSKISHILARIISTKRIIPIIINTISVRPMVSSAGINIIHQDQLTTPHNLIVINMICIAMVIPILTFGVMSLSIMQVNSPWAQIPSYTQHYFQP